MGTPESEVSRKTHVIRYFLIARPESLSTVGDFDPGRFWKGNPLRGRRETEEKGGLKRPGSAGREAANCDDGGKTIATRRQLRRISMFSMMNLPRTLMGWRMASDPRITTETRRMRSRNSPSGQYQHTTRVDQYRQ